MYVCMCTPAGSTWLPRVFAQVLQWQITEAEGKEDLGAALYKGGVDREDGWCQWRYSKTVEMWH